MDTLTELHTHLVTRFHAHAREELDTIGRLAQRVLSEHGARHRELQSVAALVDGLVQDMLPHMMKEEMILFPYVERLENEADVPASCFGTVENPIRQMMFEHDAVAGLLRALRTTTGGFVPPEDACESFRDLYRRLVAFENETHEHIRIENELYFPRALELERSIAA